ncbi:MAG: class II aldolase/adducin family protein [Myxococcota bacterium]|nr:class II aldolase/adducin family protein [Deltaproteobacteria bacterium]MDQ3334966.1 class II aldolase/adducin family protein [Myxococcota bacterium]
MSDDLKGELCRGARLLYRFGLSTGLAGHLSIKVGPDAMLVNRFGRSFGTLTPSDVLELDLKGNILDGKGHVNDTIRLHGIIHEQNPDIVAVAHAHPPAVVTFSALRTVPEVYDQESCFLAGVVGIVEDDYSGLASREDRVRPIAEALTHHQAVILPNHGAITRGTSIPHAIILMIRLEEMVQRNLAVAAASRATGIAATPIAPDVARMTRQELMGLKALPMVWEDLMARLRQTDGELFA